MRTDEHDGEIARDTPIGALLRGAAAGLAATLVLSVLSRGLPGLWNEPAAGGSAKRSLPADPNDPRQVERWQAQSQAPAAFRPPRRNAAERPGGPPGVTPAGALTQPQAPGPEGLAEQFAFKLASGVFDRDISPAIRPLGLATHLIYGSAWGALFGLIQASYRLRPGLFGPLYGLAVYSVGPAFLVPAMRIMRPPREEPPERTSMLILGHLVYGITLADVFHALQHPRQ